MTLFLTKQAFISTVEKWGTRWWVLWLNFFIYTSATAFFVQFVILPYILPQAHLGHGLFVPDSTGFHQAAVEKAAEMAVTGWSAWELRPEGHFPAGVASVFYYLWRPEPYALIPFNAVLHATAGCLVFFLLGVLMPGRPMAAAAGASLFVINPASFEWTAQIHRDGTFILGILLILTSWMLLLRSADKSRWKGLIIAFVLAFPGALLISISRPYWSQISTFTGIILYVVILAVWSEEWIKTKKLTSYRGASLVVGFCLIMIQVLVNYGNYTDNRDHESLGRVAIQGRISQKELPQDPAYIQTRVNGEIKNILRWKDTPFLPEYMERTLYTLWRYRHGSQGSGGKTVIDANLRLDSAGAFFFYLPRAFQVAFLSPFPSLWMGTGNTNSTTIGRKIVGAITFFFYGCLGFFIWCAWENRKILQFWVIAIYATFGLLVFTYAYANVGILSRMRYGFYMVIIGIGFAFAIVKLIPDRDK
jgi:hypothetical protein